MQHKHLLSRYINTNLRLRPCRLLPPVWRSSHAHLIASLKLHLPKISPTDDVMCPSWVVRLLHVPRAEHHTHFLPFTNPSSGNRHQHQLVIVPALKLCLNNGTNITTTTTTPPIIHLTQNLIFWHSPNASLTLSCLLATYLTGTLKN